jgi:hypothetical protein
MEFFLLVNGYIVSVSIAKFERRKSKKTLNEGN